MFLLAQVAPPSFIGFEYVDIFKIGGPMLGLLYYLMKQINELKLVIEAMKLESKDIREKAAKDSDVEKAALRTEITALKDELKELRNEYDKGKGEQEAMVLPVLKRIADAGEYFVRRDGEMGAKKPANGQ